MQCTIALIHPPHLFRTNDYPIFPPPWNLSDVGSTSFIGKYPIGPKFDIEPLGFISMKKYIENNSNFTVNIYNIAYLKTLLVQKIAQENKNLYLKDKSIINDLSDKIYYSEALDIIKNIKADIYAVDLHWLVYIQGAISILKTIKIIHPKSHTLIGGLTASYFKEEIMKLYPFIDFLIYGDASVPLLHLVKHVKSDKLFSSVPNLIYRENTSIKTSPKKSINDYKIIENDETTIYNSIALSRGCPLDCITCGGSKHSISRINNYKSIRKYSIDSILKKIWSLQTTSQNSQSRPYFVLIHDPFITLGHKKWKDLLREIKSADLKIKLLIEFFVPHTKDEIINIANKIPGSIIHISPESIDPEIRSNHKGLYYSNEELIMNLDLINSMDNLSMQVWFMLGLAKDTYHSINNNLQFIKNYYNTLNAQRNAIKYTELLFIDPGSLAYNNPSQYGYRLLNTSFSEIKEGFEMPIYKYRINYETKYFTRTKLFEAFLYMHNQMDTIYFNHSLIDRSLYQRVMLYNTLLKKYSKLYDMAIQNNEDRSRLFNEIGNKLLQEIY